MARGGKDEAIEGALEVGVEQAPDAALHATRFEARVPALLTDSFETCRLLALQQLATMPPPTMMRHRSAIGRLQADDDARVQQAAAAIMDGLYAPPGDDGAEPATGHREPAAAVESGVCLVIIDLSRSVRTGLACSTIGG